MPTQVDVQCAADECQHRFTPRGPQEKYCTDHRGNKHAARNSASLRRRSGTICAAWKGWGCLEHPFTPRHGEKLCDGCKTAVFYVGYHGTGRMTWERFSQFSAALSSTRPVQAVDGEGFGRNDAHTYQQLSIGSETLITKDRIDWGDAFQFLWDNADHRALHPMFYMDYDWGQMFQSLPWHRAKMFMQSEWINTRRFAKHPQQLRPVEMKDAKGRSWLFDRLEGGRRMKFKPRLCDCEIAGKRGSFPDTNCEHIKATPWFYLTDVRQFFQGPLQDVLDDETIGTPEDRALVTSGKANRDNAVQSPETVDYNQAENRILAEAIERQDVAMRSMGIKLDADEFIGPGKAIQKWMDKQNVITADRLRLAAPAEALTAAQAAYYASWTEVLAHGLIPGQSYQYDLNSAYAAIIANLPCLEPEHGTWRYGTGRPGPLAPRHVRLCHVYAEAPAGTCTGPFLYRNERGRISRPLRSSGWHWQHTIDAALSAGLIDPASMVIDAYWEYEQACACPPPLHRISDFWDARLRYPKGSVENKLMRLLPSSAYGKFAQTAGDEPGKYANPVYASMITSLCDARILEAIRTHPDGWDAVIEVATDAVYFGTRHTSLDISPDKLGAWKESEHVNLTIFHQGIRWDDNTGKHKSRGISASDIDQVIEATRQTFAGWHTMTATPWHIEFPSVRITLKFSAVSLNEAGMSESRWADVGRVSNNRTELLTSNPSGKRSVEMGDFYYDTRMRMFRSSPYTEGASGVESMPYGKKMVREESRAYEWGTTPDGPNLVLFRREMGLG